MSTKVDKKFWAYVAGDVIGRMLTLAFAMFAGLIGVWAWVAFLAGKIWLIGAILTSAGMLLVIIATLGIIFGSFKKRDYYERMRG